MISTTNSTAIQMSYFDPLSETKKHLSYEAFEHNDVIETTIAHLF